MAMRSTNAAPANALLNEDDCKTHNRTPESLARRASQPDVITDLPRLIAGSFLVHGEGLRSYAATAVSSGPGAQVTSMLEEMPR